MKLFAVRSTLATAAISASLFLSAPSALQAQSTAAAAGTSTTAAATAAAKTSETPTAQLEKIFAAYWEDVLRNSPESATSLGDKRYNDRWSDYSGAAQNAWLGTEREYLEKLGAFDTAGLPVQEKISVDLLVRSLIDDQEGARFKEWEMPVTQFGGPQTQLLQTIALMPFEDVKDYDNLIARMKKIPEVFAEVQEAMTLGMEEGRTPPRFLMEKALKQVQDIAAAKPEETPFLAALKKFPASVPVAEQKRMRQEATDVYTQQVQLAYVRFGKFLTAQYIPKARTEPGISAIPDGAAYYGYRVRLSTTLNKTPEEIHKIGLDEVTRDEAEMLTIAKKFGYNDLKSFNAAIKANPKLHPTSAQQLLAAFQTPIAAMKEKLPEIFGRLPKAGLEVLPVPAYMEKQQAAAYYEPGTPDGKRAGHVFVNTYNFKDRGLEGAEAMAYHEGIPGHHLQISISQELSGIPEFRKQSYYTAYTEGWGLYAEHLGKDVGFYQDPYSDYGRLEADIWRAIRLVVDTGVHSQNWTRQQMVDYFHDHSSIDETNVQAEVDRYIALPAQALGYKMGQLKLLELRQRAQTKLGAKFSLRDFHDLVLDSGALPLDVLEERVDTWIAAGGGRS